jgi:hypothetical protein
LVIKPLGEDHTPGTVKPLQVSLVEPVACSLSHDYSLAACQTAIAKPVSIQSVEP